MVVLARAAGCAALVAVTVIVFAAVATGAVNIPAALMLPALADQVTAELLVAELLVLVSVAENCCVSPGAIEGVKGEICTPTVEDAVV